MKSEDVVKKWNKISFEILEDTNLFAHKLIEKTKVYIKEILDCYVISFIEVFEERQSRSNIPTKKDKEYLFFIMKRFVDNQIREFSQKVNSPFSYITNEETAEAIIASSSSEFSQLIRPALLPLEEYILKLQLSKNNDLENIDEYEQSLDIIYNTMRSNGRVPIKFSKNDEDSYRRLLIHSLNGYFKGQANAEAINKRGKTDIKISKGNETILIAECKIWGGATDLNEALNQLLGYTDWHDIKTAVIIFSNKKSFSNVLDKSNEKVKSRNDLLSIKNENENEVFKCIFKHPQDKNKELNLSVLLFNIYRRKKNEK